MASRKRWWVVSLVAILACPGTVAAKDDFRLKPGARGDLCIECHEEMKAAVAKAFVHTPLKEGDCTGCHSPHASNHQKLIATDQRRICFKCHEDLIPADAKSSHRVAAEGKCTECHDPHASGQRSLLVKASSEICADCHEDVVKKAAKARVPHKPVREGCTTCHDPHASKSADHLLAKDVPAQCTAAKCHVTNDTKFFKEHAGYPVASKRCTACHDAHGSDQPGMLYDQVHEPVAKQKCLKCHVAPGSSDPFQTKKEGPELCQSCHVKQFKAIFDKTNVHSAVIAGDACLNCHSPHASPATGMLKASAKVTCGACHKDTVTRQTRSVTAHEPIAKGQCELCHDPHGSDNLLYLRKESDVQLCQDCHDWQTHSTHPIGEGIVDPRDPNLTVTCLSCHRTHGSEFKYFTHYEYEKTLCLQCHKEFQ